MAAVVLGSFVSVLLDKLGNAVKDRVGMIVGVQSELVSLRRRVQMVNGLLANAERRALYDETLRLWLAELRDVVYDVDDLIDDCRVDGQAPSSSSQWPSLSSVPRKLMSKHEAAHRINRISERLKEILEEGTQFRLVSSDFAAADSSTVGWGRQTSALADSDIVGVAIELHADCLLKLLTQDGTKEGPLVAIVGMGGVGKTTVAQRVFNDKVIVAKFQTKIWVCVSREYDVVGLLTEIIEGAGGNSGGSKSVAKLDQMLRDIIRGEKLLIVLDDVWQVDVWECWLKNSFQSVAAGSRVLVTTRFETVAKQMGAGHLRRVEQMTAEDGWSLLCKKAFNLGDDATEIEEFHDVGVKIVERCGGLPLAIKLIGVTLRGRGMSRRQWEEILENPVWTSSAFLRDTDRSSEAMVMEALYLSYEALPPHLKPCFLYLSLFPEDHVFLRRYVIQHWIAEGFVKAEGNMSLETRAEGYFRDLISRCLLQPQLAAVEDSQGKLHDLLRCLAELLGRGENCFGYLPEEEDQPMKLRRLSLSNSGAVTDLETLKGKEFLRSLYLQNVRQGQAFLSEEVVKNLIHLRVLDLSGAEIEELPNAMRKLGLLRYLNVSDTGVRKLPDWIGELSNLQFLLFNKCKCVQAIPSGITMLKNLRCLEAFDGTEVDEMPRGIGSLLQLHKLIDFHVDKEGCTLEELGPLTNLHLLGITKLERVLDMKKARTAAIKSKTHLISLSLECTVPISALAASRCPLLLLHSSVEEDERRRMLSIFDELCPPSSLEILNIIGYMGSELPSWMWPSTPMHASPLQNVTWIGLVNCIYFSKFPPLGLLRHLKKLWIKGASAIVSIGLELLTCPLSTTTAVNAVTFFPKLEMMAIIDMPILEEWNWEMTDIVDKVMFPCLQDLYIEGCPKLKSLRHGLWLGPKRMSVTDCPALEQVGKMDMMEIMQFEDNQLETLPQWLGDLFVEPSIQTDSGTGILVIKVRFALLKNIITQKNGGDHVPDDDWQLIQRIPRVYASAIDNRSATFSYMKCFSSFITNIEIT